jgi:hypothetical protein
VRFTPRLATKLAERLASRSRDAADAVGFPAGRIEGQVQRQAAVECRPAVTFLQLSQPTELAAAAAFGHTAVLAGRPANVAPLEVVGALYGRITYLLDGVRDYAADRAAGRFNALARCFPESAVPANAARLFHDAHVGLVGALDRVTLPRPALTRALLVNGLGLVGARTLAGMPTQRPLWVGPSPGDLSTTAEAASLPATPKPSDLADAAGQAEIIAKDPCRCHNQPPRRLSWWRACLDCCDCCDCCDCVSS